MGKLKGTRHKHQLTCFDETIFQEVITELKFNYLSATALSTYYCLFLMLSIIDVDTDAPDTPFGARGMEGLSSEKTNTYANSVHRRCKHFILSDSIGTGYECV
jgi:hypothetical protein